MLVTFDDGFRVCYNVKEDIDTIDDLNSRGGTIALFLKEQMSNMALQF